LDSLIKNISFYAISLLKSDELVPPSVDRGGGADRLIGKCTPVSFRDAFRRRLKPRLLAERAV